MLSSLNAKILIRVGALLACLLLVAPGWDVRAQDAQICDRLFEDIPARVPDRIEAGKACVEALPELGVEEQTRIIREYARTLPGSIDPDQYDELTDKLKPSAALPLEAHAFRFEAHRPDEETADRLDRLMARAARAEDQLAQAHLQFAWAIRIFRLGGANSEMERHLGIALELAQRQDVTGLIPFIHNALAVRAKTDGEFVDAIDQYRKALGAFEANGDLGGTGIIYANIGNIYSDLGDNRQAIETYLRAIDIYEEYEPDNSSRVITVLTNLATAYSREGEPEEADRRFRDARKLNEEYNDPRMGGLIDYQHAITVFDLGNEAEAITMAERSIPQILENRDPSEAATALNWLAKRYLDQNRLSDARATLDRAREIMEPGGSGITGLLENPGNTYWAQEYAQSMGTLLVALGQPAEASGYFDAALQLSNDRFEKEKVEAISNSELLFDLRDRDERIARLDDQAKIAELQLSQSRLQTILGFALAFAIGLLAFNIFRSYKFQAKLATSKDTLLTEMHHRTKNNLQLLTSLFSMDARHPVSAEQAKQRQLEGANRARTMALLHQHIYAEPSDQKGEVEVKPFLERLLDLLDTSYSNDRVELVHDIEPASVDIDRVTPLGLLVCELVTNAFKHAFDGQNGTIAVTLQDQGDTIALSVRDDGRGIRENKAPRPQGDGLGLTLITELAEQLGAKHELETGATGTNWSYEIAKAPFERRG
ncbi:MAG: tetratricopeptide repeat protein [Pseudomonadota bacterium]